MPEAAAAEKDYLQQDAPVRGQKYFCVSFVSPSDVVLDKQEFALRKFLESFSRSAGEALDECRAVAADAGCGAPERLDRLRQTYSHIFSGDALLEAFRTYRDKNAESIDRDYVEAHGNRTSVCGLKVRGVYEDMESATARAEALVKGDPHFHVFVGEVGCWCPWSPNPEDLKSEVYAEEQLNALVKQYKEHVEGQKQVHATRAGGMIEAATKEGKQVDEVITVDRPSDAPQGGKTPKPL